MPTRQVLTLKPHDLRIIFSFPGYLHRRQYPLCGSLGSVGMLAMKSAKQTTKEANSIRPPFGFMIRKTTLSFQAFNEALKWSPICVLATCEFQKGGGGFFQHFTSFHAASKLFTRHLNGGWWCCALTVCLKFLLYFGRCQTFLLSDNLISLSLNKLLRHIHYRNFIFQMSVSCQQNLVQYKS